MLYCTVRDWNFDTSLTYPPSSILQSHFTKIVSDIGIISIMYFTKHLLFKSTQKAKRHALHLFIAADYRV